MPNNMRILVVDDNVEFSKNVADILELKDYEVTTASDGFKALEMVEQSGYDLVLMDVKMPVMNGVETFHKLKELAPDTPVIMMTAFALEDLIKEALRGGAYGCLKKPLDFDELNVLVESSKQDGAFILVVDDDESLRLNIKEILEDKGYRVCTAYDGETAIKRAEKNNFDILLLDFKMPVLNGLETYLAIRDFRPNVEAIIITGHKLEMGEMAKEAIQKSVYTCLEKPINMDELDSLLTQIGEQKATGTLKKPKSKF